MAQEVGKVTQEGDVERDDFRGIPIVIENRKGTYREGTDPDGSKWSVLMHGDYGYIPDTAAAGDKEGLDVFIGDDETSDYAYIVEQLWDGEFDEYKVVLGCSSLEEAEQLYLSNYEPGWAEEGHLGEISEVPLRHLFDGIKEHQEKTASADVIERFVRNYERARPLYSKAADVVRGEINDALAARGIRAAVTARAKSPESLKNKLMRRDAANNYQSTKDILEDIKDMAGVRVALYFPIDRKAVGDMIQEMYDLARPPKEFPRDKDPEEPEGYEGTHFAVKFTGLIVEIQVASALMYAWAEVEHDFIYKPRLGELTPEQYQLLDELKAIVSEGENVVTELQGSVKQHTGSLSPMAARYLVAIYAARERILRGQVN